MAKQPVQARLLDFIEARTLLLPVLSGDDLYAVLISLYNIENYVEAAALQQVRIRRAQRRVRRELERVRRLAADPAAPAPWRALAGGSRRARSTSMFRDIHFYLICWSIVGRDLALVRDTTRFPAVKRALRPYVAVFRAYKDMRDHYEHFDERLPGRKRSSRLERRNDLGNLSGNMLSFGGDQVDVGPQSLRLLRNVAKKTVRALKLDAWEVLAGREPNALETIIRTVERDRLIRQLVRHMPFR